MPEKPVDCIFLLYGPEFSAREREAIKLAEAGYAGTIYYPLTNRVKTISPKGPQDWRARRLGSRSGYTALRKEDRFRHFENTHIELMVARKFTHLNRMSRILIVSSPYHMRRVKLISDRVFDDSVTRFYSFPNTYTTGFTWLLNRSELRWVFYETLKIAWFLFYRCIQPAG